MTIREQAINTGSELLTRSTDLDKVPDNAISLDRDSLARIDSDELISRDSERHLLAQSRYRVGPAEWEAAYKELSSLNPKFPYGPIGRGNQGLDVMAIQQAVFLLTGDLSIELDGVYGPKTIEGVKTLQRMVGMRNVDGIFGPETYRRLMEKAERNAGYI